MAFNKLDKILRSMRSRRIVKHIPKNSKILDFGCGQEMWFLETIKDKINYGYGYDPKCNIKLPTDNIKLINSLDKIENESIDVVTMIAVLEHIENPYPILGILYSKLKKGGKIILTTPTPRAKPILEFLAYKLKIINREEIEDHKHYYNSYRSKALLTLSNFKKIKIKYFQFGLNSLIVGRK